MTEQQVEKVEEKIEKAKETKQLAKTAQNPIGDLISLPLQNNFNFGLGPNNGTQWVLNIQPVIPVKLTDNLNLITRTILPVVYQPEIVPGTGSAVGLGNMNASFFFTPVPKGAFVWGAGPIFTFPTNTDDKLGARQWGAGPSLVIVGMPGKWVLGFLVNNVWGFARHDNSNYINAMTLQYFINYNIAYGWYLTTAPIITSNWKTNNDNRWTVPVGMGVGRVFNIGPQAVNAQVHAYYNAIKPNVGPDWQFRFQFQFLFPQKKG